MKLPSPAMIKVRVIICSLLLCLEVSGDLCRSENSRQTIRVGTEIEFSPFALVDDHNQPSGFSVDLIKAVAETAGLNIEWKSGNWDSMWNALVTGDVDVLPIVAKSPERAKLIEFSIPHTETFDCFFVRQGSLVIRNIDAARNKTIAVMQSDAAHHELLERGFTNELVVVSTIPEGLALVAQGKYDAFLCSKLIGTLAIKKHNIKGLTGGPIISDYKRLFSFGIKKGSDELREKLNQALVIAKTNGQYDQIYEKWLTVDDPWRKYRKYLPYLLPLLIAIAFLTILWSILLKNLVKKRTAELEAKNEQLEQEINERKRIELELLQHKQDLDQTIAVRTEELVKSREELQLINASLAESEEIFRSIFETSSHGILITTPEGRISKANKSAQNILGRSDLELYSLTREDIAVSTDDLESALETRSATGSFYGELGFRRKDGSVFPVFVSSSLFKNSKGELNSSIIFQDITEEKRIKRSLQLSEERLRLAKAAAKLGIYDHNIVLDSVEWDERVRELWGVDLGTRITYALAESMLHPDDLESARSAIEKARDPQGDGHYHSVYRVINEKDKKTRWISSTGQFFFDYGNPVRLIGVVEDVTARINAEKALRESEIRLEHALKAGGFGLWSLNTETRQAWRSLWHDQIFGYDSLLPEWTLSMFLDHVLPEDNPIVRQTFDTASFTQSEWSFECRIKRADGQVRWIWAQGLPRFANGRMIELVGLVQDITERKVAEQNLRDAEERLRMAKYAAGVGVHDYDLKNDIITIDDRIREIWGLENDSVLTYETFQSTLEPEDLLTSSGEIQKALNPDGDGRYSTEYRIINRKDQQIRWISDNGSVFFEQGKPVRLLGIVADITERKRNENSIKAHRNLLRLLLDQLPCGVNLIRVSDSKFIYVNPAYQAIAPGKEFLGKTFQEVWLEAMPWFQNVVESVVATGISRSDEDTLAYLSRSNNQPAEPVYLTWSVHRVELPDEDGWGILNTCWETTTRKLMEQELASKHMLLDTLLKRAPIGFAYLDRDLRYVLINDWLANINGIAPVDHIGKTITDIIPSLAPAVQRITDDLIRTGKPICNRELRGYTKKSSQPGYWNESWYPLFDDKGEIAGFGAVVEDITEPKRIEQELKRSHEELERRVKERTRELQLMNNELLRSNADLEHFAYVASHDLQEPLRTVTTAMQIFRKRHSGDLDSDSDQLIDISVNACKKMRSLVRDLLAYSRISRSLKEFEEVDINEIVEEALHNLQTIINEKKPLIACDPMPKVLGDRTQLLQIFQNLIHNAVKFGPELAPEVKISVEEGDNQWLFSVQDNGIGISPDYFGKIFEIFQQLEKTASFDGTGIGLAIVKKTVERHGGRIWVDSEVGKGSTFHFILPTGS